MEAIPILTIDDVNAIDQVLSDFLQKSESQLAVVIDKGGNIISQQGDLNVMDVTIVAALAAGSFAATKELARRIGEMEFNALYHQGAGMHIFMNSVDENTIMVTVFNDQTTVGLVRFYTANASAQLEQVLNRLREKSANETFTLTKEDIANAGNLF
ncbi:MAG: roadblock/LC7 domain-containing protein [Verrucomicrobiota bacterium]|nr:roadblock/LC7 domain-containing protein [Verrucomicrobiota bacterium]